MIGADCKYALCIKLTKMFICTELFVGFTFFAVLGIIANKLMFCIRSFIQRVKFCILLFLKRKGNIPKSITN